MVELYRRMLLIRRTEEAVGRLFNEGRIYGTVHLSIGQEAIPVGVCRLLKGTDYATCTYRGHGWALAKGMSLRGFFAELMALETGICRGRGGSMHLCDVSVGHLGASGIVGGGLPLAVGAAYGAQLRGGGAVAVASFGDGATNIGTFHESLNLAAVWTLPVIFVCENNLYGEFTPARATCLVTDFARRADAYGIPGLVVDGNDVEAVSSVADIAIERARAGDGPTLIEAKTYRHRGHSRIDPATYRPAEEVESWLARDPLEVTKTRLVSAENIGEHELAEIERNVEGEITMAINEAGEGKMPSPKDVGEWAYANQGNGDQLG